MSAMNTAIHLLRVRNGSALAPEALRQFCARRNSISLGFSAVTATPG